MPLRPELSVRLPEQVSAEQFRVKNTFIALDEKTATRRAAERSRCKSFSGLPAPREESPLSAASTADFASPRVTASGSRVPNFLAGCESPQSMRCAMQARPQQLPLWQQQAMMPMAFVLPQYPQWQPVLPAYSPPASPPPSPEVSPAPARPSRPASPELSPAPATAPRGWLSPELSPAPEATTGAKKKKRPTLPAARDREVTLLVRNLPRDLVPTAVRDTLHEYRTMMDFLYVPIDFDSKKNLGYAFLNFFDKAAVPRLEERLSALFGPDTFLQPAKIAGRDANVKRFRNSSVMAVLPEDCKPMLFDRGVQVPFPAPTRKLPPVGPRFRTSAE